MGNGLAALQTLLATPARQQSINCKHEVARKKLPTTYEEMTILSNFKKKIVQTSKPI